MTRRSPAPGTVACWDQAPACTVFILYRVRSRTSLSSVGVNASRSSRTGTARLNRG